MKRHLEKEIHFHAEPESNSLYSWCLREKSSKSQEQGRNLIPFDWSICFVARELHYSRNIEINSDEKAQKLVEENETIVAKLSPGRYALNGETRNEPYYSMFGTDRHIKDFRLRIQEKDGDSKERCAIWGGVSYTAEVDFIEETTDDVIEMHLWLAPNRFEQLRDLVSERRIDVLQVRLNRVSGFYSEWSPSISTDRIKVLTRSDDQKITFSSESDFQIPRLGEVGEFGLEVIQKQILITEPVSETDLLTRSDEIDGGEDFEDERYLNKQITNTTSVESSQHLLAHLSRNEAVVAKAISMLKLVIVLLIFIAVKLSS